LAVKRAAKERCWPYNSYRNSINALKELYNILIYIIEMNEADLDLNFEKCYEQYFVFNPVIIEIQVQDRLHLQTTNDSCDSYNVCQDCGACLNT
jgi:hypothetical protein